MSTEPNSRLGAVPAWLGLTAVLLPLVTAGAADRATAAAPRVLVSDPQAAPSDAVADPDSAPTPHASRTLSSARAAGVRPNAGPATPDPVRIQAPVVVPELRFPLAVPGAPGAKAPAPIAPAGTPVPAVPPPARPHPRGASDD